jgi:hypothetical protein
MTLNAGLRLGPCELVSPIGGGGMGESTGRADEATGLVTTGGLRAKRQQEPGRDTR